MKPIYCLPILETKSQNILQAIQNNLNDYRYFEIWLDYIKDFEDVFLDTLLKKYNERLIFVFRRQNLEPIQLLPEKRKTIIDHISKSKALIDLDITSQQDELIYSKGKVSVIASYHNYSETPKDTELENIVATMNNYQPAIHKIAATCRNPNDALRLLMLQQSLKTDGKRVIVLGMGEHGYVTRIFGTLWGNEIIFAPKQFSTQSAPGQLTRSQLETIYKELQYARK